MASAAVVLVAVAVSAFLAFGRSAASTTKAHANTAPSSCSTALVRDWSDGRIDREYPVRCYRTALRSLPADLRVYSSAPDDIRQAMSTRIVQGAQKISGHQGSTSVRKIESARPTAP